MMKEDHINELSAMIRKEAPDTVLKIHESMAEHTTFRTGGPAAIFAEPASAEEIREIVRISRENDVPYFVLGRGSNLLVSDDGYEGIVIHVSESLAGIRCSEDEITAGAGASLAALASEARKHSLSGLEFAGGIPGSVGGGLRMNAGAYGGELKDALVSACILDQAGNIREMKLDELNMRYRASRIADEEMIALSARFRLHPGDITEITGYMQELAEKRRSKQPLEFPSAGSTFKRPEGHFAGKLIEDAGLRGFRCGGACVSEKHCGFVVNDRGGSTADILQVMREVRRIVFEGSGILLEPEVRFLGRNMDL